MKQYSFLEETRLSYFKEEFFGDDRIVNGNNNLKVMHDMLDHKCTLLGKNPQSNNKEFIKLRSLCLKTFSEDDRFYLQRLFKVDDSDTYIAEFSYGLNGGCPDYDRSKFDTKWIWYVKQLAHMMQVMNNNGYFRPKLVWQEDPSHSDSYSWYVTFEKKRD